MMVTTTCCFIHEMVTLTLGRIPYGRERVWQCSRLGEAQVRATRSSKRCRSRAPKQDRVGPAAPCLWPAHHPEASNRHFLHHRLLRHAMAAVTIRGLQPTDPVHDPARLEVDDHQ